VQLHGLSADEIHRLLTETSQQTVPQPFAELVQRQTEGNPLFVRETLRFVIDTGLVERRDGALGVSATRPWLVGYPRVCEMRSASACRR
jgi:predicted ATPase